MDVNFVDVLLTIISILLCTLIGVVIGYLHTINEKLSDIKTNLAEIKGILLHHKEARQDEDKKE